MTPEFTHLFRPLRIGDFEVGNRIVNTLHGHGHVDDRDLRYLQELARGGVGLMGIHSHLAGTSGFAVGPGKWNARWGGEFDVVPPDPTAAEGIEFYDCAIPAMRKRGEVIHDEGAKVFAQVYHPGAGSHRDQLRPAIGPSDVPDPFDMRIPHALTEEEIAKLVLTFAHGIRRSKEAGLDAAEIHAAHGYILSEFLSPKFNRRTDRYGGNRENRVRPVLEIIAAARRMVADYPIGVRVGLDGDGQHGGLTISELVEISKLIAPHVAFIDVSGGTYTGLGDGVELAYVSPWSVRYAHNVNSAAAIKRAVKGVPVFVAGKITDPEMAERIIAEGSADMAGMVRALIADPELPRKAKDGRLQDIRHCLGLNECHYIGPERKPVMCAVNPAAGREAEMELVPAPVSRRVLVIGAGPAGMEAARSAALRGHRVTLMDRNDALGGTVRILAMDPNRGVLAELPRFMERELRRGGVDVRLGQEVTVDTVLQIEPDVVVVATGGKAHVPKVPMMEPWMFVIDTQVLLRRARIGRKVLVVGEMDNHVAGATVAEFLADQGKEVELVSEQMDFAPGAEQATRFVLMKRLLAKGVTVSLMTRLERIDEDGAVLLHTFSRQERCAVVDTIVVAAGRRADDALAEALRDQVHELHLIGDCLAPRRIMHATLEGARVGRIV